MKKYSIPAVTLLLVLFCSCARQNNRKFTNETDPRLEKRVDSVLSLMTLQEKIGQMNQINASGAPTGPLVNNSSDLESIREGRVGSLLNLAGARRTREAQEMAVNDSRLGIPLLFGLDVIHGYRTIFPIPLAEACTWEPALAEQSARIAATEASAHGLHWTFAPMVDIARDPRWGRVMEGSGEDPYLGSMFAAARVRGFQGTDLSSPNTILSCAKHYAAYGAAEGGRDYNTVDISERTLRDVYLRPFLAARKAGAGTFMNAFNEIAGVPSTGNSFLVNQVLKGEWNFDGFVVSDWGSVAEMITHGVAADPADAARIALKAGCDMEMVSGCYIDHLDSLVQAGTVDEKLIDDAVRRILREKFRLGLFDDPYRYCDSTRQATEVLTGENRQRAREVARKSIVLLKNEGMLLPLSKEMRTIAVIGPLADSHDAPLGNWRAMGRRTDVVSILDGIREAAGTRTRILYEEGCKVDDPSREGFAKAVRAARSADVVVAVVGENAFMSGEARSRAYIDLPGVQQDLLRALHETGTPVVVVLENGRPLVLNWTREHVPAIVEAWHLGIEEGHAVADVLFGETNPSGKLVISFPYAVGQIPVYYDHKNTGRPTTPGDPWTSRYLDIPNEPLFPFGYGLSYTDFEYSKLQLDKKEIGFGDVLTVSVVVKNTGGMAGDETVQLYVRDLVGSVTRPVLELKGFQKVSLEPGASATVEFKLTSDDLAFWNADMEFTAEPGDFKVFTGPNSADLLDDGFSLRPDNGKP